MVEIERLIRDIPDFPEKGIIFKDISPLLADGPALGRAISAMAKPYANAEIERVVGIESRGFIFGMGIALSLGCGFVPVRKPGKLPGDVVGIDYSLEYGSDRLEIQADALVGQPRVLVVDDLLATGGTAAATAQLVTQAGGDLVGFAFVIELKGLGGRTVLPKDLSVESLLAYD